MVFARLGFEFTAGSIHQYFEEQPGYDKVDGVTVDTVADHLIADSGSIDL